MPRENMDEAAPFKRTFFTVDAPTMSFHAQERALGDKINGAKTGRKRLENGRKTASKR